jgi:hypothetical protein
MGKEEVNCDIISDFTHEQKHKLLGMWNCES